MSDGATEMLQDEKLASFRAAPIGETLLELVKGSADPYKMWKEKEIKKATDAAKSDAVHKPSHYQLLPGVEVIDVRKAILNQMQPTHQSLFAVDCWSRSWEYLTRMWGKNRLEDAKKAKVYLEWLIEELEKDITQPKTGNS